MALTVQQNVHDQPNDMRVTGDLHANLIHIHQGLKTGSTLSLPAAAAGAQSGGSPPAPVVDAGSTDVAGGLTFGTGSAPALGIEVAVTFGTPFPTVPKYIGINARNDATGLKIVYATVPSATGFNINMAVAPAASQANTIYSVSWFVIL